MTAVVNVTKDRYDVYIGRPSKFGNPFPLTPATDRDFVIEAYRNYFNGRIETDAEFRQAVEALRGKTLGCFCAPLPCHGDVIVDYLEKTNG